MISWLPWMMMGGLMTNDEIVQFKLSLAAAWLENGQEGLARDLVRSIIEKAEGQNE